jgi:hypothetical protein
MVTMEKTKINTLHHLLPALISRQLAEARILTKGETKGNASIRNPNAGYDSL